MLGTLFFFLSPFYCPFLFSADFYVHFILVSHTPSYSLELTFSVSGDTELDHRESKTLAIVSCVKNVRQIRSSMPL